MSFGSGYDYQNIPQPKLDRDKETSEGVAGRSRSQKAIQGVNIDEGAGIAQWIYPSKLLSTPQSAFDFPEYPGLSVAMRLYMTIGKISWMIAFYLGGLVFGLVGVTGLIAVFTDGLDGILIVVAVVIVGLFYLLSINLGLAFQLASCEIVKVLIRIENNTRKETVNESGDE